ncbi:hypothetical protein E1B28_006459 [Marasmius oreades]|uniref:DUF8191 domain-containing protein n=1 Tax=Marasmius oreades TaxID=181124 RepID=A0A9P7UWE2_9AGAR|nr:uncharacterized protein E1B28_006459 [Marasmius oreades]KAG7095749.1 hypothetical protein E1B28_006459 [Marasmius oreades]
MERENERLRALVDSQKQRLETQEHDVMRLRAALRALTEEPIKNEDMSMYIVPKREQEQNPEVSAGTMNESRLPSEEMYEHGDSEESEEEEPNWDEWDKCYRCSLCNWEIAERRCQSYVCGKTYTAFVCEKSPDGDPIIQSFDSFFVGETDHVCSRARGTTPLQEIDPARLRPDTIAYGYENRQEEYRDLLARGATRLMCETFYLEFHQDDGIIIDMRDDLFGEWAGPRLVDCKSWKIVLGRELRLDSDDEDGSRYIDGFLEDCLLFPANARHWETIQKEPGHWITRPMEDNRVAMDGTGNSSDCSSEQDADQEELARRDYESDNSGDSDPQCNPEDNEDGCAQLDWDDSNGWGPDGSRDWEGEDMQPMVVDFEDEDMESQPDSFESDFDSQEELSGDDEAVPAALLFIQNFRSISSIL